MVNIKDILHRFDPVDHVLDPIFENGLIIPHIKKMSVPLHAATHTAWLLGFLKAVLFIVCWPLQLAIQIVAGVSLIVLIPVFGLILFVIWGLTSLGYGIDID